MSETLAEAPVEENAVDENVEAPETEASVTEAETPAPEAEQQVDVRELQAELEYVRGQHEQLVQWARQQGATPAQAQAAATAQTGFDPATLVDEYGNLDPAAFAGFLQQRDQTLLGAIDQRFNALLQPLAEQREQAVVAEGEQQMRDVISNLASREGELLVNDDVAAERIIEDVRNRFYPALSQRLGDTNRTAELALEHAFKAERDRQKAIGEAAVQAHVNRNATLAGARSEAAPGVAALETASDEILPQGALAQKYGANAQRLRTT